MSTITNNKLPEWRKALNSAVENYQSTQAWYEENQDSPSAGQDMDAAEGEIEKLIKQYGVLIVLNLLDEIDELQERRQADSAEPACYALTNMAGEVYNTHSSAQNAGAYRDLIHQSDDSLTLRVTPLYTVPPAPVVPEKMNFSTACNFVQINGMAKEDRAILAMRAWNACRSVMLNGGKS